MSDSRRTTRLTIGPYKCVSVLGAGDTHTVYYALHRETARACALRAIQINRSQPEGLIAQCQEQLTVFAEIKVPNIVPIIDYGSDKNVLYIASELMRGNTLLHRIQLHERFGVDTHPLPNFAELTKFLERMAQTLDNLHAMEITHGAVDPSNILFDDEGNAFLADIGLTRLTKIIFGLDATNSFNMSKYSAPELWDGQRPEPASDQYSIASIMYHLTTGRPPFEADTIYGLMQKHLNEIPLPPHAVNRNLPDSLALPFWQALSKPIRRRHSNVTDFYQDFRDAVSQIEQPPTGFFTRTE